MERRKSPWLVVYPGVAPGFDVVPMAVVIRSPIRFGGTWKPYVAILGGVPPGAVLVQVLVAHNVGGNVARRIGVFIATVACRRPAIKLVLVVATAVRLGAQLIGAAEGHKIICVNGVSRTGARDFALATADANGRGVTGLVDADPIDARS